MCYSLLIEWERRREGALIPGIPVFITNNSNIPYKNFEEELYKAFEER